MTKSSNPFIDVDTSKPDLRKKEEPLISLRITNPITYIKSWWKKVMNKEGVDFRFKIQPLTAIAMTIIIATIGFGVGQFTITKQKPYVHYTPFTQPTPTPTPNPWRDTAFSGTLRFSKKMGKFYLLTNSSEAINITVLENVDLEKLIGRRIFATGEYNENTHTLIIYEATNMELLPEKVEEIPVEPEPTILPTPEPNASDEADILLVDYETE